MRYEGNENNPESLGLKLKEETKLHTKEAFEGKESIPWRDCWDDHPLHVITKFIRLFETSLHEIYDKYAAKMEKYSILTYANA